METTIFADGLANIRLVDGVLRFDLVNITGQPSPDKLEAKTIGSVAMTLQGLVRSYNKLSGVMNQLTEQGALKRTEPQPPSVVPVPAAPTASEVPAPSALRKLAGKRTRS